MNLNVIKQEEKYGFFKKNRTDENRSVRFGFFRLIFSHRILLNLSKSNLPNAMNQFARDACSRLTKAIHTATIWIWLEHHFSLFLAIVPPNNYRSLADSSSSITKIQTRLYILHSSLLLCFILCQFYMYECILDFVCTNLYLICVATHAYNRFYFLQLFI